LPPSGFVPLALPGFGADSGIEEDGVEEDGVEEDGVEEDGVEEDLPWPPYPSLYQPPPLSWNADREISFSRAPEHFVHFFKGLSLNFWITSSV
jgi:hypothetical protein